MPPLVNTPVSLTQEPVGLSFGKRFSRFYLLHVFKTLSSMYLSNHLKQHCHTLGKPRCNVAQSKLFGNVVHQSISWQIYFPEILEKDDKSRVSAQVMPTYTSYQCIFSYGVPEWRMKSEHFNIAQRPVDDHCVGMCVIAYFEMNWLSLSDIEIVLFFKWMKVASLFVVYIFGVTRASHDWTYAEHNVTYYTVLFVLFLFKCKLHVQPDTTKYSLLFYV